MTEEIVDVAPSKLGTKDYWDSRYDVELTNFAETGDEGEIWFGRSSENRILNYLSKQENAKSANILDLGCGNGSVLRRLREKGFSRLCGVDYCEKAVDLARKTSEKEEDTEVEIDFKVLDILAPCEGFLQGQFDYLLDKGTWDAMSLCEEEERRVRIDKYVECVRRALLPQGQLVIFSCNFTKEELCKLFPKFKFHGEIPAQTTFSFGGKAGVTSTGAVFTL